MAQAGQSGDSYLPKDLSFYQDRPPISDAARRLLREYSKIPDAEIDAHVERIRQNAFKIFPYPCIGMNRFLDLSIISQKVYAEVLERLKNGDKFLDLGCCFGQEIRQLILDGAPAENLVGADLRSEFFAMGHELFRDESTLSTKMVAADVFDANMPLRKDYAKQFNIIYTGSFFHLFTYEEQITVANLVNDLLISKPGSMLIGRQVGNRNPGETPSRSRNAAGEGEKLPYRHNAETWKAFWNDFGEQTGTKWSTEVEVEDSWNWVVDNTKVKPEDKEMFGGMFRMSFVVRRL